MRVLLSSIVATAAFTIGGGCTQTSRSPSSPVSPADRAGPAEPAGPAASAAPTTDEGKIEAMLALNDAFVAVLSQDVDCDKLATALDAFGTESGDQLKTLKAAMATLPAEAMQHVQAAQGERIAAFSERVLAAERRCGSNARFADAFGSLVEKRTERPPTPRDDTEN